MRGTHALTKVNLLLFLTPHIIRTRADFESISERKRQERQKLVEQFWGERGGGEPPVDFTPRRAISFASARKRVESQIGDGKISNGVTRA